MFGRIGVNIQLNFKSNTITRKAVLQTYRLVYYSLDDDAFQGYGEHITNLWIQNNQ